MHTVYKYATNPALKIGDSKGTACPRKKILFNSCQQQAQGTTDKAAPEKPAQQPAVPPSTDPCTQPKGQQLEAAGSSWKQLEAAESSWKQLEARDPSARKQPRDVCVLKLTKINGDGNLCIGSTATLACFGVKLLSTMAQLYIGSAAKLLCFCVKTTKGNFKLCIGSVAKLLRNCSMDKKGNTFFYFFSIRRNP